MTGNTTVLIREGRRRISRQVTTLEAVTDIEVTLEAVMVIMAVIMRVVECRTMMTTSQGAITEAMAGHRPMTSTMTIPMYQIILAAQEIIWEDVTKAHGIMMTITTTTVTSRATEAEDGTTKNTEVKEVALTVATILEDTTTRVHTSEEGK